jgi:cytochrome d ubiquinol oxidase subunit I
VSIVGVTYWSFRLMIGAGILMLLITAAGLVLMRRAKLDRARWFQRAAATGLALPITEVGRQPWVVFGLLKTSQANSPNVGSGEELATLTGYIVIYGILIAVGG